jgi:hypothetical protein
VKHYSCRFKKLVVGVGVVLVSLLAGSLANATSSVGLNWSLNPDPSIAGYNVYYGTVSHSYTSVITVGNTNQTVIDGLTEGKTYYFAVTAYTFDGLESDFSAEYVDIIPGFLTLTSGATPSSPVQIQFPVATGHWYELQLSTDLVAWVTIWQTTGTTNQWVEFDVPTVSFQRAFYRTVQH